MTRSTPAPYQPALGDYQGVELQRPAGLPDGRMRAFDLPSRMGDYLHYPDGRVLPFPLGLPT